VSPALPQVSGKQVVLALEAAGFEYRSTKGSHAKLRHPDGRVVIVPLHRCLRVELWVRSCGKPA
jgi:predicted RNA binding protein YcfA (HicA-like mRNA interferase family)